MRLGIVTGLYSEAKIVQSAVRGAIGRPEVMVRCAGASSERAGSHAGALIGSGAEALISFGVAGALDPDLSPGALIAPPRVLGPADTALSCDAAWHHTFVARITPHQTPRVVNIASSDTLVSSVADKQALRGSSGAGAVDMESLAVAEAADAAGVPFLIIRAIADPASRAPPPAALRAIAADGRVRYFAAAAAVLRDLGSLPTYLRLARDNRAALATLGRVAALSAPFFGLV